MNGIEQSLLVLLGSLRRQNCGQRQLKDGSNFLKLLHFKDGGEGEYFDCARELVVTQQGYVCDRID